MNKENNTAGEKTGRELVQDAVRLVEKGLNTSLEFSELARVYGLLLMRVADNNGARVLGVKIASHEEYMNSLKVMIDLQEKPSRWRKPHIYDIGFTACNSR